MEIYILTLKNDGVRTFRRCTNAYNYTLDWLKRHNLYMEKFDELWESYQDGNFTSFKIKDLVKCHRTEVEDYEED